MSAKMSGINCCQAHFIWIAQARRKPLFWAAIALTPASRSYSASAEKGAFLY